MGVWKRLRFEWDPVKSAANEDKHGIGFEEARELWSDPYKVHVKIDVRGEDRWGIIARYAGGKWVAVCTTRGSRIRIISVRRANARERSLYDKENHDG